MMAELIVGAVIMLIGVLVGAILMAVAVSLNKEESE